MVDADREGACPTIKVVGATNSWLSANTLSDPCLIGGNARCIKSMNIVFDAV